MGLRESRNFCSHSVVKLCEATRVSVMVDYAREMTVMRSCNCKCGEYLLFLFYLAVGVEVYA